MVQGTLSSMDLIVTGIRINEKNWRNMRISHPGWNDVFRLGVETAYIHISLTSLNIHHPDQHFNYRLGFCVVKGPTFHAILHLFLLKTAFDYLGDHRFVLSRGCNGPTLTRWREAFLEKSITLQCRYIFASFYAAWSSLACSWKLANGLFPSQVKSVCTPSLYFSKVHFKTPSYLCLFHSGLRLEFRMNLCSYLRNILSSVYWRYSYSVNSTSW